ncbi:uncharacterized protein [Diadema antillarum]|uniref:uncharacterized protein n=1 Tax=Diadema antillarum TaxID=105358 RepID=UPI003A8A1A25
MGAKESIQQGTRCRVHNLEKELFCEECRVYICSDCVPSTHSDHEKIQRRQFEDDLEQKVRILDFRSKDMKAYLNRNVEVAEEKRQEINSAMEHLKTEVREACSVRELKDLECSLIYEIESLHRHYNEELDTLKHQNQQKMSKLNSMMKQVATDKLKYLETESLTAHESLCSELGNIVKEEVDDAALVAVKERAFRKQITPAGQDVFSVVDVPILPYHITKSVSLRSTSSGMASLPGGSVALGYRRRSREGIDLIDSTGCTQPLQYIPSKCYPDVAFLSNETLVAPSLNATDICAFSPNGFELFKSTLPTKYSCPNVSVTSSDEILVANTTQHIYIFESTSGTLELSISTEDFRAEAARSTRAGPIVSTASYPGIVTAFDRDGQRGNSVLGSLGEHFFVDVDEEDRIYILTVRWIPRKAECSYKLSCYRLDGLNLKETAQFAGEKLTLKSSFCYLVCLQDNMLALVSACTLYFIQVPPV